MSLEQRIQEWLLSKGRACLTVVDLLDGLNVELNNSGMSVFRVNFFLQAFHSERKSSFYVWRNYCEGPIDAPNTPTVISPRVVKCGDNEVSVFDIGHGHLSEEVFRKSPFQLLLAGWSEVRCRLEGTGADQSFPILDDLKSMGATDYIAVSLGMVHGKDGLISFSTKSVGGFSETDIESFRSIRSIVSYAFEIHAIKMEMENVLATYLGPKSAEAILGGQLRRGDIHPLEAVIGFVDIRGFTKSGGLVGNSGLVRRANHFYQCLYDAITPEKGEISKFIGDGALFLFPVDGDSTEACARALSSMRRLKVLVDELNQSEVLEHDLDFGVALHLGAVEQGNIGAMARLDYTVIGSAVNMASRFEGLAKRLKRRMVVTQAVAEKMPLQFEHLGDYAVRGVTDEQSVFGLIGDPQSREHIVEEVSNDWKGKERRTGRERRTK